MRASWYWPRRILGAALRGLALGFLLVWFLRLQDHGGRGEEWWVAAGLIAAVVLGVAVRRRWKERAGRAGEGDSAVE